MTGPRSKKPRRSLTEDEIVHAALRIIRGDGLEALTMRRLSQELDMSAMAAYYYVANKEELLDLVATRALSEIRVPTGANLEWHVRLHMLIDRVDAELRHYRGVGEVLLERMHSTQRHVMRGMMELFEEAGFDDGDIVMAYALVHTYLFGRYRVSMSATRVKPVEAMTPSDDLMSRIQPLVGSLRGRDYYEFGVDTLIAGLRAQLEARRASQSSGGAASSSMERPQRDDQGEEPGYESDDGRPDPAAGGRGGSRRSQLRTSGA